MSKKIISLFVVIILSLSLAACGKSKDSDGKAVKTKTTTDSKSKSSELTKKQGKEINSFCKEFDTAEETQIKQQDVYFVYFGYAELTKASIPKLKEINEKSKEIKALVTVMSDMNEVYTKAYKRFSKDEDYTTPEAGQKMLESNQEILDTLTKSFQKAASQDLKDVDAPACENIFS